MTPKFGGHIILRLSAFSYTFCSVLILFIYQTQIDQRPIVTYKNYTTGQTALVSNLDFVIHQDLLICRNNF